MVNFSSAPDPVYFEITQTCNLSCPHCFAEAGRKSSEMPTDVIKERLIDEIRELGTFGIVIGGGEPLLRKDFFDIVTYAADAALEVGVSTNGTLMDSSVVKTLTRAGVSSVQVSLDGADAATHDAFRGKRGVFKKAVNAVKLLSQSTIYVVVSMAVHRHNLHQVKAVAALANTLGAQRFRAVRYIPAGRGKTNRKTFSLSAFQAQNLMNTLGQLKKYYKNSMSVTQDEFFSPERLLEPNSVSMCTAGTSVCAVRWNGEVLPCSFFPDRFSAGNIIETRLREIWHYSRKLREFRNVELLNAQCRECRYLQVCRGGCRAAALGESGDISAPDPLCPLIQKEG